MPLAPEMTRTGSLSKERLLDNGTRRAYGERAKTVSVIRGDKTPRWYVGTRASALALS